MWSVSKLNSISISLLKKGFCEDSIGTAKQAIQLLRDSSAEEGEQDQEHEEEASNRNSNNNNDNDNPQESHYDSATRQQCPLHESRDGGTRGTSDSCHPMMGVVRLFGHASQHRPNRSQHPEEPYTMMMMMEDEDDNEEDYTTNDVLLAPSSMIYQDVASWPLSSFSSMIYCRAFVFNEDFCSQFGTDTAAILHFNLGVAYHLYARLLVGRSVIESNKKMQSALQLYKIAWTTLNQHGALRSSLLTMALLTNMSQVLAHFSQHEAARECLEGLEQCLADSCCVNGLEEEDLRFFCFNLTYSCAVAPAA